MIDWTLFNALDWVIVVVVCLSVGLSLWRGFTREAISLAGWVAAFVLANLYAAPLAAVFTEVINSVTGRYVIAYALLFVGTLILSGIAASLARQVIKVSGLSLLDRLLGTAFGLARGLIIILVAVYMLRQLVPPQNLSWLHHSQLMPHIDMLVQWVQTVFAQMGKDLGPGMSP